MIIELLDGTILDTYNYNLRRLFHYIPSAEINHVSASVEGSYDLISDSKLNNRVITVQFLYDSQDIFDYYLLRDELNSLFMRTEPFYIIFKKEPYKKYLVKTNKSFSVPPNPHMQSFEVEFVTLKPYGISSFSTVDIVNKEWDLDLYGWNGNINWDNTSQYSFTDNNFSVNNLGTYKIDPRESDLKITIKGSGNFVILENLTNGQEYRYNAPLTLSDELVIDGVRTFKNGVSNFSQTNRKVITLEPGINEFSLRGTSSHTIDFDFNFLYK